MAANTEERNERDQPSRQTGQEQGAASGTGLLDTLLELGGTLTLRDALAAWQHEQDRLFNRSWRRPGGLARPAGL